MARMSHTLGSAFVLSAAALTFGCSSSSTGATDDDAGKTTNEDAASSGLPSCSSKPGKNAFETYGSAGFVAVNKAIFANVTAEITKNGTKNLGTSFTLIGTGKPAAATDPLATFEGKLAAFLVNAYGGPSSITYTDGKTYSGMQDMTTAHTGFNITADQYNYFVTSIIVPALTSSGVSMADVSSCFAPVITGSTGASFMASIVGH